MEPKLKDFTGIISLSGGADSATLLGYALNMGAKMEAVGFRYGSKHNDLELACAYDIAQYFGVPFTVIDLVPVMQSFQSALLDKDKEVPTGAYNSENMRDTVVPARNLVFATILAGIADSRQIKSVWLGVHGGDHHIYPDCRPETINALQDTIRYGTDHVRYVEAPFLNLDKKSIIRMGLDLGVPYSMTRTCYTSDKLACGKCGSCNERLEAFAANGATDPIQYQKGN